MGLSPEQLEFVSTQLAEFLTSERERHRPQSVAISAEQKETLRAYFRPELLERTRVRQLGNESLRNPDFYSAVRGMGIRNLPDLSRIEALTFVDVIVFVMPITTKLLFHELVHAEQFRQMGALAFARRYANGFMQSETYEAIPLEIQAYGLGAHFEAEPNRPFAVEEEVGRWIADGRF